MLSVPRPQITSGPNLFMKLPPELRNRVYELVLPPSIEDFRLPYTVRVKLNWNEPPMAQTSKEVRAEIIPMFYAKHEFTMLAISDRDFFKKMVQRLKNVVVPLCGPNYFTHLPIDVRGSSEWIYVNFLPQLLPLLELMRATGFEPAKEISQLEASNIPAEVRHRQLSASSCFRMSNKTYVKEQFGFRKGTVACSPRARTSLDSGKAGIGVYSFHEAATAR
jgi:hypothetical protein